MSWKLIQDTREVNGWFPPGIEVVREYLEEGDYTSDLILDYEKATGQKLLRIERKASASELALTLGKNNKNFIDEMERLRPYEHVVLLFEFPKEDMLKFPRGAPIPAYLKRKVKMTGKVIAKKLYDIGGEYSPLIIFSRGRNEAMHKAISIIEEVHKEWTLL